MTKFYNTETKNKIASIYIKWCTYFWTEAYSYFSIFHMYIYTQFLYDSYLNTCEI